MSKIAFLIGLVFISLSGFSQQEYFLYLQTEDRRPFYARLANQMYSSSENGYLIISKLQDSKQELTIGFPKNEVPEQRFTTKLEKNNRGYLIRNLADKGWVLVNLQTSDVITSSTRDAVTVSEFTGTKKTDPFSEMLANVVNDSAILYNAVRPKALVPVADNKSIAEITTPANEPQPTQPTISGEIKDSATKASTEIDVATTPQVTKKDTAALIPSLDLQNKADSSVAATTPQAVLPDTTALKEPDTMVVAKTAVEKPFLTKLEESKTDYMYQATYLELYNLTTDTIRIYIPVNDSIASTTAAASPAKTEKLPPSDSVSQPVASVNADQVRDTAAVIKIVPEITNSDCKNFATDHDLDKLRIRLLDDKTIDEKIASARKFFKAKCYSVSQIKALTELFPTDETKYRFFDTSYAFVSDTGKFFTLEEVFSNDFYRNKFKALIHK